MRREQQIVSPAGRTTGSGESQAPRLDYLLDRPLLSPGKRLFVGGERSVRRTLATRAALVAAMLLSVVVIFWLDRGGLQDEADGRISFVDVVYFSMVTVTTVGYGDIVPVTHRARMIDALLVTPIRLFIWLIFLGTAYQLVLQRLIEDLRMRALQSKLRGHVIICGYGHSGRCAASELVARGLDRRRLLIVDVLQHKLEQAAERGYIGLLGDATHEEALRKAMLPSARALFVCTDRDDTNVLIVLTARNLAPHVRIVARVEEAENEKLVRRSGADATVLPSRVGGILMADSLDSSAVAASVMDLISAEGDIALVERAAHPQEVGRRPGEIAGVLVVEIVRDGRTLSFWDDEARIRADDTLVLILPTGRTRGAEPAHPRAP